ncbi:MAG: methyltransferase domain-containing protein [Cyclobacteriaceae bacterium]|nr:methyltransferase domain-containing protein [Cyclobacteriaceae bacterium]
MKQLISFFLRYVPRKYLQLVSHYVLKVISLFYRGNAVICPVCDSGFRKFLPYGRVGRSNALCPNCLSLERHRLIWLYLKRQTSFFEKPARMLHIAPEHCFISRFDALPNLDYLTGDIESPLAKIKMDIHAIPLDDASFDIVFCNHVLEHVRDDHQALSEIYRVLRPGGWAILQVPFFYPLPDKTIEDPEITDPKEREKLFGQDDHVRKYGTDYAERLQKAGFELKENFAQTLTSEEVAFYALDAQEVLYVVEKR